MSGGLLPAPEPRRRGRPKGSTNKRPADLRGYMAARYGGSTALQLAQLALISPAELKAAGGVMAKAVVAKATDLVEHVRRAQAARDEAFRETIRDEFERLLLDVREVTGRELRQAMDVALKRVREAGAAFTLREAMDYLAQARRDLLPYTDQRQPLAIEAKGAGFAPSVVVQVESAVHQVAPTDAEFVEVFEVAPALVSPVKSHEESQGVELPGLLDPPPTD